MSRQDVDIRLSKEDEQLMLRLQNAQSWVPSAITDILFVTAKHITDEARREAPRDTGAGVESMRAVSSGQQAEIRALPHMIVMDQGRRPGQKMPPVDAIQDWVTRRAGRGQIRLSGGATDRVKQARGIAWAIARAIAKNGIEGRKYIEKSTQKALRTREWRDDVTRQIEKHLRKTP